MVESSWYCQYCGWNSPCWWMSTIDLHHCWDWWSWRMSWELVSTVHIAIEGFWTCL
jgi:hypothetical protein